MMAGGSSPAWRPISFFGSLQSLEPSHGTTHGRKVRIESGWRDRSSHNRQMYALRAAGTGA
jgi:hypothetical protein